MQFQQATTTVKMVPKISKKYMDLYNIKQKHKSNAYYIYTVLDFLMSHQTFLVLEFEYHSLLIIFVLLATYLVS